MSSRRRLIRSLTLAFTAALLAPFTAAADAPDTIEAPRPGGTLLRFGGEGLDRPTDAAIDARGRVYVVGGASSAWSGGRVTRDEVYDRPVVLAFDPDGRVAWSRVLAPRGFVFTTAWDARRQQLVSVGTNRSWTSGQVDIFVVAHDRAGHQLWRTDYDASDSRSSGVDLEDMTLGPDGTVYITGHTRGDLAGARHIGTPYNGAHNGWDVFVLALHPDGRRRFVRLFGVGDPDPDRVPTQYNDYARAIAVADGRLHIVGGTEGDLITHRKKRHWRRFHLSLTLDGKRPKVRYRPRSAPVPTELLAAPGGGLYLAGIANAEHDAGASPVRGVTLGQADLFLERLDRRGKRVWARRFGTDRRDTTRGIAVDRTGQLWISTIAGLHSRPDGVLFRFDEKGRPTGHWAIDSADIDEPAAVVTGPAGVAWVGTVGGDVPGAPSFEERHVYQPADGFVRRLTLDARSEPDAVRRVAEQRALRKRPAAVNPLAGR